jgi:hypothetical protein
MAHFVKLDENNNVLEVHVVSNAALDELNEEQSGISFLTEWSGGYSNWKQTSYNGKIRKNYAGVGYFYDENLDAFIPPKPYNSWILNEDTCLWEAPVPIPNNDNFYSWNEETLLWDEVNNG